MISYFYVLYLLVWYICLGGVGKLIIGVWFIYFLYLDWYDLVSELYVVWWLVMVMCGYDFLMLIIFVNWIIWLGFVWWLECLC